MVVFQQANPNRNLNPVGWSLYIKLGNIANQVIHGYDPLNFAQ